MILISYIAHFERNLYLYLYLYLLYPYYLLFSLSLVTSRLLSVTLSRIFRFALFYTDPLNPFSLMSFVCLICCTS